MIKDLSYYAGFRDRTAWYISNLPKEDRSEALDWIKKLPSGLYEDADFVQSIERQKHKTKLLSKKIVEKQIDTNDCLEFNERDLSRSDLNYYLEIFRRKKELHLFFSYVLSKILNMEEKQTKPHYYHLDEYFWTQWKQFFYSLMNNEKFIQVKLDILEKYWILDKLLAEQHVLWLHLVFHAFDWKNAEEDLKIVGLAGTYKSEETSTHLWLREKDLNDKTVLDIWWWVSPIAADLINRFPNVNYISVDPKHIPNRARKDNTIIWNAKLSLSNLEDSRPWLDIDYLKQHLRNFFWVKDKIKFVWWVWWSLPIASESTDLVIISYLLTNILSKKWDIELVETILREASRCTNDKGEVVIIDPTWATIHDSAINSSLSYCEFEENFSIRLKKEEIEWFINSIREEHELSDRKKEEIPDIFRKILDSDGGVMDKIFGI